MQAFFLETQVQSHVPYWHLKSRQELIFQLTEEYPTKRRTNNFYSLIAYLSLVL